MGGTELYALWKWHLLLPLVLLSSQDLRLVVIVVCVCITETVFRDYQCQVLSATTIVQCSSKDRVMVVGQNKPLSVPSESSGDCFPLLV